MELLTGDRMDDFLEAAEQANAIPQPQAWNGIDGLLNGKPFIRRRPRRTEPLP